MFSTGSHATLQSSIEAIGASVAIFTWHSADRFTLVSANSLYEEVVSSPSEEILGAELSEIFPRYLAKPIRQCLINCRKSQKALEQELAIDVQSETRWWRFNFSPVMDQEGSIARILNTCIDITEKKKLERELHFSNSRFQAVVESAYDGLITIDNNQNICMINNAARDIFGIPDDQNYQGTQLDQLIPARFRAKHPSYIKGFRDSPIDSRPMQTRAAVRALRSDGREIPIEVTIAKIQIEEKTEMMAIVRDISERNQLIDELRQAAILDPLTRCYNRRFIEKRIQDELSRHERFKHHCTIAMIDIDHFKQINDSFGHNEGDLALSALADLLRQSLRAVDILGRWGGEEFIVLLPETAAQEALAWAERARKIIATTTFTGHQKNLTVSIGITQSRDADQMEALIDRADKGMYEAKAAGRNTVLIV